MNEDASRRSHECVDCHARSPETETSFTLISSRHGWRLTRAVAADGTVEMQWRCPTCWSRVKKTGPGPTR